MKKELGTAPCQLSLSVEGRPEEERVCNSLSLLIGAHLSTQFPTVAGSMVSLSPLSSELELVSPISLSWNGQLLLNVPFLEG